MTCIPKFAVSAADNIRNNFLGHIALVVVP